MEPFRIPPNMPAVNYKTYEIAAPRKTHWRPATCEEVDCQAMANGWRTAVDESTDLGQKQAHYIRKVSRRSFTEGRSELGLTEFLFGPGQQCFGTHQVQLGRPEFFLVRGGDYRGNPLGTATRRHTRPDDWVDDFATHQQHIADEIQKG